MGWGDELMVTGRAREAQARDPRKVKVIYEKTRWHEAWLNNPRIASADEEGDFQILYGRVNGLRPYIESKRGDRWTWRPYRPPVGELYLSEAELAFGAKHVGRIIIEPNVKAGPGTNKDWGWSRWADLAMKLRWIFGAKVAQLGPTGTRVMPGVEWIQTFDMRLAAAVLRTAEAVVVPEGGMHHICAAVGTPAVVIFGGFISPEVTGYESQTSFFTGTDLGCGMRTRCDHCRAAMANIAPGDVMASLIQALESKKESP